MSTPKPVCASCGAATAWAGWLPELVHARRAALVRIARAEGLGGEDAFEVVQEAFCAFLALPEEKRPEPADAGRTLAALTRNRARNRRRLHATARPHLADDATVEALAADEPAPEDALLATEDRDRLACCMARLADVQRAVVTLRMLDELPGADVARQLGLKPGHVAVLLHRAKAALASCLAEA